MSTALIVLLGLGVIVVLFMLYLVSLYNGIVGQKNRFQNALSQIDVQLKRRYDLIPNLVEVAKGFMKHERETLEAVIRARNTAFSAAQAAVADPTNPQAMQSLNTAETALAGSMTKFLGLAEAYPDLKANQNMLALQEELSSTENKVAFARQAYNDAVMNYNTAIEQFPGNIVAGFGNFRPATAFVIDQPEQRDAVKVQF